MKVILNKDIAKVGREDEVVAVSDGYARNYLFPRGLAVEAAGGALRQLEIKLAAEDRKAVNLLASAQAAQVAIESLPRLVVEIASSVRSPRLTSQQQSTHHLVLWLTSVRSTFMTQSRLLEHSLCL